MNFTALVVHGLSALSVFSHIIGVRLLVACSVLLLMAVVSLSLSWLSGGLQLTTPSWFTGVLAWILVSLVQAVILGAAFVLLVLSSRQGTTFIPKRDYRYFVASVTRVSPRS